jgi:glycosyltransferase involved in cell wall biosynthesis
MRTDGKIPESYNIRAPGAPRNDRPTSGMEGEDVSAPSTAVDGERADWVAPLLSVTVLNYNYAHYLPHCLDSILEQTLEDFEVILVNDCSTDNSLEVIGRYLADPRIRLIDHTDNKGYIFSLLEGARLSRGKYITVISADDYCVSNSAFQTLLMPMEADENVVLSYSAHGQYSKDGRLEYLRRPHPKSHVRSGTEEFCDLALEIYILHSGAIIRATAYSAVGGYDPTARYAGDTLMWFALCRQGKVAYSAYELYAYRRHDSNMSTSMRGIRGGLHEHIRGLERAFVAMSNSPDLPDGLHRRAMKRTLSAPAIDHIFAGRVRSAWYAYWCAVCMHPVLTVFQAHTLVLLARTILGPRQFQSMRTVLRRGRRAAASV